MKKSLLTVLLILSLSASAFAYTEHNIQSANFIAGKWIINDNSTNIAAYNLGDHITRREMLKVMMNLSGKTVAREFPRAQP